LVSEGERNEEGTEAEPRFAGTGSYQPQFTPQIGLMGFLGAKSTDKHPLRSYNAVIAGSALLLFCLGLAALFVWLH